MTENRGDPRLHPNLSLVLERITDGFFALDAQWRIAYMNAEARKLLDAPANVIGRYWLDAFPKARGRLFEREYRRAMAEQLPVQFVEYSATADCWFEVKAYPSEDGLSAYFRDVTARIEAERELARTARRQQALIDFGRAVLAGVTDDRSASDATKMVRDTLEVPAVEILNYDRKLGTFAGGKVDADLVDAVRSGKTVVGESAGRWRLSAPIGPASEPAGAIVVYSTPERPFDAGEIRFVESVAQTLGEAAKARDVHGRVAQVLESVSDAFVAVDREMRITYVNVRMATFWKQTPEKMIGLPISEFTDLFDDRGRALEFFEEALHQERPLTFENTYLGRWFETRVYPFSGGIAAYTRDITRRKLEHVRVMELNAELERRVEARTKQLELANKELESFSYSVSHDLRAPLRAIDGFSQALVEDYSEQLDGRALGYLDRVRKAAQRMADLIDALLRLSKVARATITFAPIDLSRMALAVAQELREQHPGRAVEVVVEPGLQANGERQLIYAVLENLLSNAFKFTRDVADARIEVGKTDDGEFFVRDNGAGFDMAYGNKLFGAFQRLHSAEEYEGTGIGLATVARIVHRHGGSIRAEGATGRGATLYFTLPAIADGAA